MTGPNQAGVLGNEQTKHGFRQVDAAQEPDIGAFIAPAGNLSCSSNRDPVAGLAADVAGKRPRRPGRFAIA